MLSYFRCLSLMYVLFSFAATAQPSFKSKPDKPASAYTLYFNNLSDLRSSDVHKNAADWVYTGGYFTANDGGGALYQWVDTCTHRDDSSLYIKPDGLKGAGRYIYVLTADSYNVLQLGAVPNGKYDNTYRFQYLISSLPEAATLFFPTGSYFCANTLTTVVNKSFHIIGSSRNASVLIWPPGKAGLIISKANYLTSGSSVEHIKLMANGRSATDGKDQKGKTSADFDNDYVANGLTSYAGCRINDVWIYNWSGNGLKLFGSIRGNGSNVSNAFIQNIVIQQCNGNGVFILGDDANGISFYNIDCRDNLGYGVNDHGFLGNSYFGGEMHNNKLGHFSFTNINAVHSVFGIYQESDRSGPNYCNGRVAVLGGFQGRGWKGPGQVITLAGPEINKIRAMRYNGSYEYVGIERDSAGIPNLVWDGGMGQRFFIRNTAPQNPPRAHFVQGFGGVIPYAALTDSIWQMVGPGSIYSYNGIARELRVPSHGFNHFFIGSSFIQAAPDTLHIVAQSYYPGDRIINTAYDGTNAIEWVATQPGTGGVAMGTLKNVTANCSAGGITFTTTMPTNMFHVGEVVNISGYIRKIVSGSNQNSKFRIDSPIPVALVNAKISYVSPGWQPFSNNTARNYTPTSSKDASGVNGDVRYDANYLYIKTDGVWKRAALSTF